MIIHFWWIIIAILLAVYGHDMIVKSKKRSVRNRPDAAREQVTGPLLEQAITMRTFPPEVIPTRDNEWIIELSDDHVDSFNRRQFTANWLGHGVARYGFEYGHRGQVFHTDLDEFIARHEKRGRSVRVVGPLENVQ